MRSKQRPGPFLGFLVIAQAAILVLISGCSDIGSKSTVNPSPVPDISTIRQIPPDLRADLGPVVAGNTAFATDLYGQLRGGTGNLFFCPYSISTAFAMTWAGARGTTETEMVQVLHFPFGQEQLHPIFGALQRSLEAGSTSPINGYQLELANRLWGAQGYAWRDSFLTVTREAYEAELQPMRFEQAADSCRQAINQWVSMKTGGNITDLLPVGSIPAVTRLVLTNAIYFKGRWARKFDPSMTTAADFHTASGTTVKVSMMRQTAQFGVAASGNNQILAMPYAGGDLSMIVLLPPDAAGLAALEASLTPANLAAWNDSLHPILTDLYLPKFTCKSRFSLKSTFQSLGMISAFDPQTADFSGMDGSRDLVILDAYHQAFVKVDEEGTEAAGGTGIVIGPTAEPVGATFRADHPFLFLIRDNLTGSVLFLGRVVDPTP